MLRTEAMNIDNTGGDLDSKWEMNVGSRKAGRARKVTYRLKLVSKLSGIRHHR